MSSAAANASRVVPLLALGTAAMAANAGADTRKSLICKAGLCWHAS